jgi:hypothetical protein
MTFLRSLITRFSCFERPAKATQSQLTSDAGGGHSRFDSMWDEALLASIHCETAHTFLAHMGPRWK